MCNLCDDDAKYGHLSGIERNDGRRAIDKQRAVQHYSDQQRIAELEKALQKISALPARADGCAGMVDFPHEKALRVAGNIADEALGNLEIQP